MNAQASSLYTAGWILHAASIVTSLLSFSKPIAWMNMFILPSSIIVNSMAYSEQKNLLKSLTKKISQPEAETSIEISPYVYGTAKKWSAGMALYF